MKKITFWKSLFLLCALIVGSTNGWATEVTYSFSQISGFSNWGTGYSQRVVQYDEATVTFSSANKQTSTITNIPVTKGQPVTLVTKDGKTLNSVTFVCRQWGSKAQTITLHYSTNGGTSYSTFSPTVTSTNFTISKSSLPAGTNAVKITFSSSDNQVGIESATIDYSLPSTAELAGIYLSGTYPTTFTEKDEFSHEGMTVTANYDDNTTKDVTGNATFTGYDMNTIGNQTVTVSYTEGNTTKTATYGITVNAGSKYTVTFDAEGGTCGTSSLTEEEYKGGVTLPSATCTSFGWSFAGWAEASISNTLVAPTLYAAGDTYKPTTNKTLYAVYKNRAANHKVYTKATSIYDILDAGKAIIVYNSTGKILNNTLNGSIDAPVETDGKITPPTNSIFTIGGNNTDGITFSNTLGTIGTTTNTASVNAKIEYTNTNNLWIIEESTIGTNNFSLHNKRWTDAALQYNSNTWKVYNSTGYNGMTSYAMRIYIPSPTTAYNSNPSAIAVPTVAFADNTTKVLYVKNANEYTNAATATGTEKNIDYSSSDETIASVDENGAVTALKAGTAIITARIAAEAGVSAEATDTYIITVKDASTIASVKAVNTTTTAKAFTADLTDANITYVSGTRAYIQDASAAIYVSCATNDWAAGKKFNGAVSGKVKKSNGVWEISELTGTPVEGGSVPAALTDVAIADITAETYASYEGKKITLAGVTVTTAMASSATSGGEVSDGTNTIKIGAPATGINLVKDERGSVTGFVAQYNSAYRLNIYEQSQFAKTHNAPNNQPLEYANATVTLNKHAGFSGETTSQTLTGAKGAVTYEMTGDEIGTINETTGVVTLNGSYGTATIKATAAATEEEGDGGIIQPYKETTKSYTLTISQIFEVTFSINEEVKNVRQETAGAAVEVPAVNFLGNKVFVGWGNAANATSTVEMGATYTPTEDKTFYALFATATIEISNVTKTIEPDDNGVPSSYQSGADCTINGITYNSTNFSDNDNSGVLQFKKNSGTIYNKTEMPKIQSIVLTYNSGDDNKNFTVTVGSSQNPTSGDEIEPSISNSVYTFDCSAKNAGFFVLQNGDGAGYLDKITINYKDEVTTYSDYTSNVGTTNVIIDGNAESIDLSAMTDATALAGVHADAITYTRTMGKLSTLYLPYASTIPDGMTAYEFNGINDAGTALNFNVVEGNTLNAYTPYVLEQEVSASKTLSATDVDIVADTNGEIVKGEWTLMGTIARIENADLLAAAGTGTPYIVQSDKKWHPVQANAAVYIPAFRAYFIVSAANGAKVMEMNLGGETTSIDKLDVIDNLDDNAPIFNLAGQKVTKSYKGVVIQNGKKVVNK